MADVAGPTKLSPQGGAAGVTHGVASGKPRISLSRRWLNLLPSLPAGLTMLVTGVLHAWEGRTLGRRWLSVWGPSTCVCVWFFGRASTFGRGSRSRGVEAPRLGRAAARRGPADGPRASCAGSVLLDGHGPASCFTPSHVSRSWPGFPGGFRERVAEGGDACARLWHGGSPGVEPQPDVPAGAFEGRLHRPRATLPTWARTGGPGRRLTLPFLSCPSRLSATSTRRHFPSTAPRWTPSGASEASSASSWTGLTR